MDNESKERNEYRRVDHAIKHDPEQAGHAAENIFNTNENKKQTEHFRDEAAERLLKQPESKAETQDEAEETAGQNESSQ